MRLIPRSRLFRMAAVLAIAPGSTAVVTDYAQTAPRLGPGT